MTIHDLVFVGFNSRVAALHKETGTIVWQWRASKPRQGGYVTILHESGLLIIAVSGYMYGLNPETGEQLWYNEMSGFGTGVTSLATIAQSTTSQEQAAAAADAAARAAAAGAGA